MPQIEMNKYPCCPKCANEDPWFINATSNIIMEYYYEVYECRYCDTEFEARYKLMEIAIVD